MATTYKTFTSSDITNTKTLLHEVIPLTGTIVSGTYSDLNIKNYTHGIFQSVFDYPYLS
jgi:propanediol dehydratase large subunit